MNRKRSLILFGIVLTLLVSVGIANAQGPKQPSPRAPSVGPGTAFTYQGELKSGGAPVNNTCDFAFGLWDSPSGGAQMPGGITQSVSSLVVSNGLFTVQLNGAAQFGATAFNGDARWLAISVVCPSGGSLVPLNSRQALTPAPMAFALPGLYTQQNGTSPNVIGGYSGNAVSPGVYGTTIGGGGYLANLNSVTGSYSTVSGGYKNTAVGGSSTVSGGDNNSTGNDRATVGGGYNNHANGVLATVGGGDSNTASNDYSTIGGGSGNNASGTSSTVGGGNGNSASNSATVAGGVGNSASKDYSTIGGGYNNHTNGMNATIGGGTNNTAGGDRSTVPGGLNVSASHYGEMAYASGNFASIGDAQTSVYVVRNTTTNATQTELFLDGGAQRITIASGRTVTFDILVVGRRNSNNQSAGYAIRGIIKNDGGTTALVGALVKEVLGEDNAAWDATVVADDANDALEVKVTGAAATTIGWVASVRTVEVSY